jgi:hypothetical protein
METEQSFTAKGAKDAKEEKSFTAEAAKVAKEQKSFTAKDAKVAAEKKSFTAEGAKGAKDYKYKFRSAARSITADRRVPKPPAPPCMPSLWRRLSVLGF